jgi:2-phosphosulfolactate phosphatase
MTIEDQPGFDPRLAWASEGGARVVPAGWPVREGPGRVGPDRSSLSPVSLLGVPAGTRVELASPNGAAVSLAVAAAGAVVLAGCLRNASAVAAAARDLGGDPSPEARAAVAAFLDAAPDLPAALATCASGLELAARGLAADLRLAAEHDASRAVPRLSGDAFAQLS